MPTYTTRALVEAYPVALPAGAPGDALILTAERSIDDLLGPIPRDRTTGLKFDPTKLYAWQADALARAVAAQAEYLLALPDADLVGATRQATAIDGPDFKVTYAEGSAGPPAKLGPKAASELAPLRELLRIRHVRARP